MILTIGLLLNNLAMNNLFNWLMKGFERKDYIYLKIVIGICFCIIGSIAIVNIGNEVVLKKTQANKIKPFVDSNNDYGNALKYVKIKGSVNEVCKMYYCVFFSVKPDLFEFEQDSLTDKKVFYEKDGCVWFFQTGVNAQELSRLKVGDLIEKEYGESKF